MSSLADLSKTSSSPVVSKSYTVSMAVVLFVVLFTFLWVLMYSFQPTLVCVKAPDGSVVTDSNGDPKVDKGKAVVGALLISLVIILALWLFSGPMRQ